MVVYIKKLKVVMLAFYDSNKNILLNRRNDSNEEIWGMIGGGIEVGEKPIDTVRREVLEEINYQISEVDNLEYVSKYDFKYNEIIAEVYVFKARFPGFNKVSSSNEINVSHELRFFNKEVISDLPLMPITKAILNLKFGADERS